MVSAFNIRLAAQCIRHGGVIAYPTEAVYGLGCDPLQQDAVEQILKLKQRPVDKGLIVVGSQLRHFDELIEPLTSEQKNLIQNNRTTTWTVPAQKAPFWLRGKHQSLAIRLSEHPVIIQLCDELDHAIVSTSANPAGKNPAVNALKASYYFPQQLDFMIHANTGKLNKPTQIKDLLTQKIFRSN